MKKLQIFYPQTEKKFRSEVNTVKLELTAEKKKNAYPELKPYWAGRAHHTRQKLDRLRHSLDVINETSWLGEKSFRVNFTSLCEPVFHRIEARIDELCRSWLDEVSDQPKEWLNRRLMVRVGRKHDLLKCNIDPRLLELVEECKSWLLLERRIPESIQSVYGRWDSIKLVYDHVEELVNNYNNIVNGKRKL